MKQSLELINNLIFIFNYLKFFGFQYLSFI